VRKLIQNKEIAMLLKEILDRRGVQAQQLAKDFNVAKSTVSSWISGDRNFDLQLISQLADYFKVPISYFTGESKEIEVNSFDNQVVKIPVIGEVKAGYDLLADQNIIGYEFIPQSMLNGGEYFYLKVTGDSMIDASISDGDLVLVRRQPAVDNGQIAVIMLDNNEITIKRVHYEKNEFVILHSENTNYPPRLYKFNEIKIQGLVKQIIKKVV
jgi:repressor LexA